MQDRSKQGFEELFQAARGVLFQFSYSPQAKNADIGTPATMALDKLRKVVVKAAHGEYNNEGWYPMKDPTPLKQAGSDLPHSAEINYNQLREKCREMVEHRNATLRFWEYSFNGDPMQTMAAVAEKAAKLERLITEIGDLVGVECLQSDSK